jgi:hypothetical protein
MELKTGLSVFPTMQSRPRPEYFDEAPVNEAFDIAWSFVLRAFMVDEDDPVPQAFLAAHILRQYEQGERRKLALANRAIAAYAASDDPEGDAARALGVAAI